MSFQKNNWLKQFVGIRVLLFLCNVVLCFLYMWFVLLLFDASSQHQAPQNETRMFVLRPFVCSCCCYLLVCLFISSEQVKGHVSSMPLWWHQGVLGIKSFQVSCVEEVTSFCQDRDHTQLWAQSAMLRQHVSCTACGSCHLQDMRITFSELRKAENILGYMLYVHLTEHCCVILQIV